MQDVVQLCAPVSALLSPPAPASSEESIDLTCFAKENLFSCVPILEDKTAQHFLITFVGGTKSCVVVLIDHCSLISGDALEGFLFLI